ncbi:MAG: hypothetical protein K9M15_00685 [Candidatus Marinimicrobia bacterium]|nr:hypothetical protein [Candidatus Neomarinimicrobiota bacterium]
MANSPFPELEDWDKIRERPTSGDALGSVLATEKLVTSIAHLRLSVSTKIGYLNGKIERLQKTIDNFSVDLQKNIKNTNDELIKLNGNIQDASSSSTQLAKALNKLTLFGVLVAGLGAFLMFIKFLYENKIWPFTQ